MSVGALLVIVIGIVLTLGHGPVGPESVVRKDVADYVERAALHADAIVSLAATAEPGMLTLPSGLEFKCRVSERWRSWLMALACENAMQLRLIQHQGSCVRCLVVLRGDHVIGIAVIDNGENSEFASQVRSALETQFRNYEVHPLREGAYTRLERTAGELNDMAEKGHIHHSIDYVEFSVTYMAKSKRFYEAAFDWRFNDYGPGLCRYSETRW